jgi:hypothetical protein
MQEQLVLAAMDLDGLSQYPFNNFMSFKELKTLGFEADALRPQFRTV